MPHDITLAVIITTRNEEKNIGNCLKSISSQSYQPIEIIVVDNYSTDKTLSVAQQYTPWVYTEGPERSAQRNFGASKTKGDILLYLDADMILDKDLIAEAMGLFTNHQAIVGLYVPEIIVGSGFWINVRRFERAFYNATVIDAARFVKRDVFIKMGGFDTAVGSGAEDWDFNRRLKQYGSIAITTKPLQHNEHAFSAQHYLQKKKYYMLSLDLYRKKWGSDDPVVKQQLGFWYRYVWVYLEEGKWLRLVRHPILTLGMYYLRIRLGIVFIFAHKKR